MYRFLTSLCMLSLLAVSYVQAEEAKSLLQLDYLQHPSDKVVDAALSSPTLVQFVETPLGEALSFLSEFHDIEIRMNQRALEEIGLSTDTPITCSFRDIPLNTVLEIILSELELTYRIDHGVLEVTTLEQVETQLYSKFYHLTPLLKNSEVNHMLLINYITTLVDPDSWETMGGPASVSTLPQGLVVRQSLQNQQKIVNFLNQYGRLIGLENQGKGNKHKETVVHLYPPHDKRLSALLESKTDQITFIEVPLVEALIYLSDVSGIDINLDTHSLEDIGLSSDEPVTLELKKGHSVRFVLTKMLEQYDLTFTRNGKVLTVLPHEELESRLALKIYPLQKYAKSVGFEADTWLSMVYSAIDPESWDHTGGLGRLDYDPASHALLVMQTSLNHHKLQNLLTQMPAVPQPKKGKASDDPFGDSSDDPFGDAGAGEDDPFGDDPFSEASDFEEGNGLEKVTETLAEGYGEDGGDDYEGGEYPGGLAYDTGYSKGKALEQGNVKVLFLFEQKMHMGIVQVADDKTLKDLTQLIQEAVLRNSPGSVRIHNGRLIVFGPKSTAGKIEGFLKQLKYFPQNQIDQTPFGGGMGGGGYGGGMGGGGYGGGVPAGGGGGFFNLAP